MPRTTLDWILLVVGVLLLLNGLWWKWRQK